MGFREWGGAKKRKVLVYNQRGEYQSMKLRLTKLDYGD
jgi:hypothetical protein